MKAVRILGAVFLGRNTGHLAARFEFPLWTFVGLLLLGSTGDGIRRLGRAYEAAGKAVPEQYAAFTAATDTALASAVVLGGYVIVAMIALVALSQSVKGEPVEDPAA